MGMSFDSKPEALTGVICQKVEWILHQVFDKRNLHGLWGQKVSGRLNVCQMVAPRLIPWPFVRA